MMLTFQLSMMTMLPAQADDVYIAMAYDQENFFLLREGGCAIDKLDACFQSVCRFQTMRTYSSFCFDQALQCFWATPMDEYNRIYQLNARMQEVDCIHVSGFYHHELRIFSVSCEADKQHLLICCDEGISRIVKEKNTTFCLLKRSLACTQFNAVQSIRDGYIGLVSDLACQYASVYGDCNELRLQCHLASEYVLIDLFEGCTSNVLYALAHDECGKHYVLQCILNEKEECNTGGCTQSKPDQAAELIESIALMETSLSHILNAEGEKIQKVLQNCASTEEILCVNEFAMKTIIHITHLEHVLYAKLELAKELCQKESLCNCCQEDPCDSCIFQCETS